MESIYIDCIYLYTDAPYPAPLGYSNGPPTGNIPLVWVLGGMGIRGVLVLGV